MPFITSDPSVSQGVAQQGIAGVASGIGEGQPWLNLTDKLARSIGGTAATYGTFDDNGNQITPPEPSVNADALQQKYHTAAVGSVGALDFTAPMPDSVAKSMWDAKQDEIARADANARSQNPIARSAAGFAAFALDPVNTIAMFLPGIGEARAMGALAKFGVDASMETMGGRLAVRAVEGATGGAAWQVPLSALNYGLSKQEGTDYSMADAAADVAGAGLGGAILHPLGGFIKDAIFGRYKAILDTNPDAREAAGRAAIAAAAEDRPVDVADLIDVQGEQASLRNNLAALRAERLGVPDVADAAQSRLNDIDDALTQPESEITADQRASLQSEHAGLSAQLDQSTQDRLSAIDDELGGTPTPARRQALTYERGMLTDGQLTTPQAREQMQSRLGYIEDQLTQPGADRLPDSQRNALLAERANIVETEQGRAASQRAGLMAAITRSEARINELNGRIGDSETVRQAMGGAPLDAQRTSALAEQAGKEPVLHGGTPPEPGTDELAQHTQMVKQLDDDGLLDEMLTPDEKAQRAADDAETGNDEGTARAIEAASQCMAARAL